MKYLSVYFLGHREIQNFREVEEILEALLYDLVTENEYIEFYVGMNGDFDTLATSLVRRLKKRRGKECCSLTLVLPYPIANMDIIRKGFDSLFIPEKLTNVYPKAAIYERNRWLIDTCDLGIFYVQKSSGGARKGLLYANKLGKRTLNIADKTDDSV